MEWIVSPIEGIQDLIPIVIQSCCNDRAFSGECKMYYSCDGTARLIIHHPPV